MSERLTIPPLVEGDRLDRFEFERRYEAMPHIKKAELIEGIVYIDGRVPHTQHGQPHGIVLWWLNWYLMTTPHAECGDSPTVRLDDANEPQPDAVMFLDPECGGMVRMEDGFIAEAPELIFEVSFQRVDVDLGPRKRAYQANGVREYIVWRTDTNAILWFVLRDGIYQEMTPDAAGILKSEVFPGLWLDVQAMLQIDLPAILAVLHQGLATQEHADFVALLQQRRTGGQP